MYVLDGQWYMEGIDWDDEGCIHSSDELLSVIESVGFLPLFSSGVPGFSVEEMTDTSCWWNGDVSVDPWEWRAVLARTGKVAYGKFYGGRAGQKIGIRERDRNLEAVVDSLKNPRAKACDWLEFDEASKTGTFTRAPEASEVPETIDMQTVVELYSR